MLEAQSALKAQLRCGFVVEGGDRHRIVEHVVQPGERRGLGPDLEPGLEQAEVMTVARAEHHAMLAERDRLGIAVGRDVIHGQAARAHGTARAGGAAVTAAASSVQTTNFLSTFGPNVVAMATSAASRPRAISIRPMRGTLLRA